jgi:hypothetical protein
MLKVLSNRRIVSLLEGAPGIGIGIILGILLSLFSIIVCSKGNALKVSPNHTPLESAELRGG